MCYNSKQIPCIYYMANDDPVDTDHVIKIEK